MLGGTALEVVSNIKNKNKKMPPSSPAEAKWGFKSIFNGNL